MILWKEIKDLLRESTAHLDQDFDYEESERFERKVLHILEIMKKLT